jgi:hypothetical protein
VSLPGEKVKETLTIDSIGDYDEGREVTRFAKHPIGDHLTAAD